MKPRNLTAKHAGKFNKAAIHKDRKKASKRGEQKHKNTVTDEREGSSRAGAGHQNRDQTR